MTSRPLRSQLVLITGLRTVAAALAVLSFASSAGAADIDADPSNYQNLVSSLAAGDTLHLAPGTYTQGLALGGKSGTASQPIIVVGPDDQSAVFTARDCCSTVQLDGTSYLQLLNLTLDGGVRAGKASVNSRGNSHDITLENLKIIGRDRSQQTHGISTEGPAWNWVIRRNTIIGAGTGLSLGSPDGTQPFVAGLIEYNLVVDTLGYNLKIDPQLARPTDIGLPTGNSVTIIRHNVFSKQTSTATRDDARPNVQLGHFPLTGVGATDRYEIYGNFFYQNPAAALLRAEGNLTVHDNLFVNSAGDAVDIRPQDDKPRSVTVYNNTVVASGAGLRISGGDPTYAQRLTTNASFAGSPIAGPNQSNNVTGSYASAADALNAPFAAIGSLDLYPKTGHLSGAAVDVAVFSAFADGAKDFNGTARTGLHRGAYEGEGINSGWHPALSIKPSTSSPAAAVTLVADSSEVALQGSSTLEWSVADASSCTASDGWSGSKQASGSETVGPIAADTTYSVTCTTPTGTASKSVRVQVVSAAATPTVTISASPGNVSSGGTSILSWTSTGANACSASGGWSGTKPANGSETVGPLQSTMSFQLTCLGTGGNANSTVQVTVGGSSSPPTTPPTAPPTTPPTTPPVTTDPTTGDAKSGGGSLDWMMIGCLALLAGLRFSRPATARIDPPL